MSICALGHEHESAWDRIDCDVTEDFCFICSRATDHRGEHEPADLEGANDE
jgi:hypothetical protein